ncbi:lytic polysaccharide monooxygenase auxiliary activity family 9 protein [Streptomyces sp. NPDC048650]|uniref:lytic polysaccharide monooxygenase auxiliary activity family 9 protein n=1 Tax=unclassified Streptomyces TaxID=2593676 RepID=UPI003721891A
MSKDIGPRHGSVTNPPSRAQIYLQDWQAEGLEAGKFFPQSAAGLQDPFASDDIPSNTPPADGKIASAGQSFAAMLDEAREDWKKHTVSAGQEMEMTWHHHIPHKTRRWNYFLTKPDWDPTAPLTRTQFEAKPFTTVQNSCRPYWSCDDLEPSGHTTHTLPLPERQGYHVLLSVWEVADTGNAFYQVIDLDFG